VSEKTTILQCSGQKNNGSRCTREKEFRADQSPREWYCWQHEYQKFKHGFRLPNNLDYKLDGRLKHLAKQILNKMPELFDIRDVVGIENIGFVRCFKNKNYGKKIKYAECRKVKSSYKAFIPYDYIITFYDYNTSLLSQNQKKLLMYHELKHIDSTGGIIPHDVEDFSDILKNFGIDWAKQGATVPDILSEEVV